MRRRSEKLNAIKNQPEFDVLVIGAGANGAGTFRDLAMQGVRVLMVDKDDYSAGASAGSSHMLHGGIRYLENGEFRLVREALHERNLMLLNAPHYAKPLPTTIPMFHWMSGILNAPLKFIGLLNRPSERGAVVIKLGLMMYDLFTGPKQTMPKHDFVLRNESLAQYPHLNKDIVCTATYYDAWMPYPERIVLEMIMDAETANENAIAVNYLAVTDGEGHTVTLTDEVTGETLTVKPKVVINAGGPWIDFVNRAMEQETRFIGGTKGSHLILDNPTLYEATGGHEFFFENSDGRIVLIFPYMNRVMVGTTDIRIDDPDEAIPTEDEVEYILGMIGRVFPKIEVTRDQIVYKFTGVRPLPSSDDSRTGAISRDHSIRTVEANGSLAYPVHSLIGGKWTTFRAFSEQAADVALKNLGKSRKVSTENIPIGGGKDYPTDEAALDQWLDHLQSKTELERDHLRALFDKYGTYAEQVAEFVAAGNDEAISELADYHYTRREIHFIAQHEQVVHLTDLLQRRSLIAMLGYLKIHPKLIDTLAEVTGEALGWSDELVRSEVSRTLEILQEQHQMMI